MKITDVSKVVSGPNPHHVDARKIYETPHAMAVVITLQPGEALVAAGFNVSAEMTVYTGWDMAQRSMKYGLLESGGD